MCVGGASERFGGKDQDAGGVVDPFEAHGLDLKVFGIGEETRGGKVGDRGSLQKDCVWAVVDVWRGGIGIMYSLYNEMEKVPSSISSSPFTWPALPSSSSNSLRLSFQRGKATRGGG